MSARLRLPPFIETLAGRRSSTGHPGRPAPRAAACCPNDFQTLRAALRRQLEWADDYRRAGDLPAAITAMVDAAAIDAELTGDKPSGG